MDIIFMEPSDNAIQIANLLGTTCEQRFVRI